MTGGATRSADPGGRETVVLTRGDQCAEIAVCGAQALSWHVAGRDVLWTASHPAYAPGKAVRGGIPVVFPWFGAYTLGERSGELPPHGFARERDWRLTALGDGPRAAFELRADDASRAVFPHEFRAELEFALDGAADDAGLRITMRVHNEGADTMVFEQALHTYFAVGDVRSAEVRGLENVSFAEHAALPEAAWDCAAPLRFRAETDRVFQGVPPRLELHQPALRRRVRLDAGHAASAIVWNPWIEKTKRLSQMALDDWQTFCCIETANARDNAVRLPPGASHVMSLRLTVAPLA
ncbi:MAG: D-hexose-6-phosphate mutarotase [Planctomycetes bacterium]|nr:D-hexose-6-phosphate mutarotase [Planctomycetota bacterium]